MEQKKTGGRDYWVDQNKFKYPILQVSPEVIFSNQVQLLDANFIREIKEDGYLLELKKTGPLKTLREIIASWYVTLRTIAIVRFTFSFNICRY